MTSILPSDNAHIDNLLKVVLDKSKYGNPDDVLKTIDTFCWTNWQMHIGDKKGLILDNEVIKKKPLNALELGTFCGYSAIRIARLLPDNGKLYTFEINPVYQKIAKQIIEHAGLTDKIVFILGTLEDNLDKLKDLKFDFVFLDHWKNKYLSDFQILEKENLMQNGTVTVADNMGYPAAPDFLKYILDNTDKYSNTYHETMLEYNNEIKDLVYVLIKK